jgi:hypothetical protein
MNRLDCSCVLPDLTLTGAHCWICHRPVRKDRTPDYGDRTAPALPLSWFTEAA